jgi:hypothetical protein
MKMNFSKCLLVLIVCLFSSVSVNAVKVKFGINVDMLMSSLTTSYKAPDLPDMDVPLREFSCSPKFGMGFGVKVKIDLWKGLGIESGVGYSFYGMRTDWGGMLHDRGAGRVEESEIKFDNFYFPVLVFYKINIPAIRYIFVPSVSTGPVIEFAAGPRTVFGENNTSTLVHWKFGIELLFKEHFEFSAGYNLPLNNAFTFGAVIDSSRKYKTVNNKVNYWSVGVGYFF